MKPKSAKIDSFNLTNYTRLKSKYLFAVVNVNGGKISNPVKTNSPILLYMIFLFIKIKDKLRIYIWIKNLLHLK